MNVSRASAVVLLLVLVASPIVGSVSLVGSASAAPDGFVGVPDANIQTDLPSGENVSITESDLEGSVMASTRATTMDVILTTPNRASEYVNGSRVGVSSGDLALVIRDEMNHAGREVALPADAIREAVGHVPDVVYGVHEDGERWSADVSARSGLLIFEVPHFSSNTVTFSGEVSISGTFTDGSTTSYELTSLDAASDPTVNLTGRISSELDTTALTGTSQDISLAGNLDPRGPNGTTAPRIRIKASSASATYDIESRKDRVSTTPNLDALTSVTVPVRRLTSDGDSSESGTIRIEVDGTVIKTKDITVSSLGSSYVVDVPRTAIGSSVSVAVDATGSSTSDSEIKLDRGTFEMRADPPSSVTASTDTGASTTVDLPTQNEWHSGSLDLATGTHTISLDAVGGIDVEFRAVERVAPSNVSVSLNDATVDVSGTLNDGETVSRTVSRSALRNGLNTLTVDVGPESLESDAPAPRVAIHYKHDTSSRVLTEYASDGWAESYNVSHTFGSTVENPTLTVPFSREVYDIRRLEISVDGGSWQSVAGENYALENTTLTVQLDDGDGDVDVDAGTEIQVRTTGYKVNTQNGQITVVEPTTPSDNGLDAEFRVDSRSEDFAIAVGSTKLGERVHYTYKESWDNALEKAVIDASGAQLVYLPNAPEGGSARITTIPLKPKPESGDVGIHVADPDTPTFAVSTGKTGSGSTVTYQWLSATAGETYGLYSISRGRYMDKSEAGTSGVSLLEDDSEETFRIDKPNSSGAVSDALSGSSGGVWKQAESSVSGLKQIVVVGAWAALVVLLVYATGKSDVRGRARWALVGTVGLGSGLLSLEVLRPGTVSSALSSGLADVVPIAGLAAVGIVGYSIVSWWQSRKTEAGTPETKVSFSLGKE